MSDSNPRPPVRLVTPINLNVAESPIASRVDPKTFCDRCGAEMYRLHAVWRCPACGFKTDCCGW